MPNAEIQKPCRKVIVPYALIMADLVKLYFTGALDGQASGLRSDAANESLSQKSRQRYDAFSPGTYEWPALLHRCDRIDPSYKS